MTSMGTGGVSLGSATGGRARAARPGIASAMGRSALARALARVSTGRVRVLDRWGELATPASAAEDWLRVTVRVHDPRVYGSALLGGTIGLAESYMDGAWDTDDLGALVEILTRSQAASDGLEGPLARVLSAGARCAYWLQRNTRSGSRRNIAAHYDLGNEFFALFLDPTLTYSCAIFEHGARTLEEAQVEKIDRACRKLELRASDHLLEIGTGWGALAVHAAKRYGCRVTTTTISARQFEHARERVRAAGVADRVEVVRRDYRDLEGAYDKLVSIEMIEAVGRSYMPGFFRACERLLKPDGAALIQAIVIRDQFFEGAARRRDFLKKYVFPGSCLMGVRAMLDAIADGTDLRLWHLEDIGPHYVTTLRMWREAFLGRLDDVRGLGFDERFIRMWTFYLAYCEGVFRARHTGDVQMLLCRPGSRLAPVGACLPAPA